MKTFNLKRGPKNRSAVSPVIATILMVAITVVLAAVLYVMAMGIGSTEAKAPTTELIKESDDKFIVSTSPTSDLKNFKFSVNGTIATGTLDVAKTVTVNGLTITFVDSGNDGKLTSNDYFTVNGTRTPADAVDVLTLLWINADSIQSVATTKL